MKKAIKYTIGIIITLAVGLVVGYISPKWVGKANDGHADTTTVITYKEVPVYIPTPSTTSIIGNFVVKQVPILLALNDTIREPYYVGTDLIIPREQKYYSTSQYKAWISGYKPSLDSMTIFQPTTTITIENTAQKVARNELYLSADIKYIAPFPAMTTGITAGFNRDRCGVSLGGGIIAVPNGVKWYALVGLKYNLLTKKW